MSDSDPSLPEALIAALDDVGVCVRPSGTLIMGLGSPLYLSQVRKGISVRYGVTDSEQLDLACSIVDRAVLRANRPLPRDAADNWVNSWRKDRVPLCFR